ncbi:MAG: rRNA maturation RNase YbeY [Candidatus Thiodiazotropha sp. (ex Ctena orbiculata)]|uniref:Endoribonuclease YbeY n=1 Tax=Candidatus Thiodiazotropha taylori TaxID=2792791 RepID=A0A944M822_9GAMM|nr:rRNA maturation RNase YbeY [Candidatus Thiodiazotropha taylori]PUB84089.1 MAG: rRNA maturation RNase YbeY [gamma proteobacterium symbiont of Ctena orbiculata]MBT2988979.1 rRNA maturation RNase YbeY [Candidatus Thiodiazotropha taylori]MBT2996375.1 rRNA maturation RNase YbeY [Candidatus Thiodiazotropha taylori]MBT3000191.1 rRNA maturation RNase YbeY [Candidatus Thiodiazotropha taylori]
MESLVLEVQRVTESSVEIPADEDFRRWVEAALPRNSEPVELVIRLVDEAESRQLNRDYRGKDGPTNVLSFPFEAPPQVPLPLLGDLVICVQVVVREATEQGKEPRAHWAHMVIHGVLHLLGYDHQEGAQAQRMESEEREILRGLDFSDPYDDEA